MTLTSAPVSILNEMSCPHTFSVWRHEDPCALPSGLLLQENSALFHLPVVLLCSSETALHELG